MEGWHVSTLISWILASGNRERLAGSAQLELEVYFRAF